MNDFIQNRVSTASAGYEYEDERQFAAAFKVCQWLNDLSVAGELTGKTVPPPSIKQAWCDMWDSDDGMNPPCDPDEAKSAAYMIADFTNGGIWRLSMWFDCRELDMVDFCLEYGGLDVLPATGHAYRFTT
jgi:hypothetical protein